MAYINGHQILQMISTVGSITVGSLFTNLELTEEGVDLSSIASGAYQVSVAGRLNFRTSSEETSSLILGVGDLVYTFQENTSWHKSVIIYAGNIEYIEEYDGTFKRCSLLDLYYLDALYEDTFELGGDGSQFLANDGTYKPFEVTTLPDSIVTEDTIRINAVTMPKLSSDLQNLINGKQNTLTAGDGISIVDNVISVSYPNGDSEVYGNE